MTFSLIFVLKQGYTFATKVRLSHTQCACILKA